MVGISGQFRTILTIFDPPLLSLIRFQAQWFLWLLWRLQRLWHTSLYGPLSDLRTPPLFDSPLYFRLPILSPFTYDFGSFDTPLPSSLFDSKSSDFCGYYGSCRGSWHTLHFTVPSPIYEPFSPSIPLYAFGSHPIPSAFTSDFDDSRHSFTSSLFDSKPSDFCGCYGSYRGSGIHFNFIPLIYGSPLRFTVPSSDFRTSPTSSKTSNACITAVIAEVLAYIFRTILGALSGCFE
jgi:hypothetical protein